ALIWTPDGIRAGLEAAAAETIGISQLCLVGTERLMTFTPKAGTEARIAIENCEFKTCAGTAVVCLATEADPAARLRHRIRIADSVFQDNGQAFVSNVDALFDNNHVYGYCFTYRGTTDLFADRPSEGRVIGRLLPDDPYADIAQIVNQGRMRIDNVGGVPYCRFLKRDLRWVDNSGELLIDNMRFGAEFGGLESVHLLPPEPGLTLSAAIRNCWGWGYTGKMVYPDDPDGWKPYMAYVVAKAMPEWLILQNIYGPCLRPAILAVAPPVQFLEDLDADRFLSRLYWSANLMYREVGRRRLGPNWLHEVEEILSLSP
ncbi:MAG: hypothetical protein U1E27_13225, partial [Kiritimatiellia bacterium]|nr:hypothetical protein [Kiritimatiellia bacterium]